MEFSRRPVNPIYAGQEVALRFELRPRETAGAFDFRVMPAGGGQPIHMKGSKGGILNANLARERSLERMVMIPEPGDYSVEFSRAGQDIWEIVDTFSALPPEAPPVYKVSLEASSAPNSNHEVLWDFIKSVGRNLQFKRFAEYAVAKPSRFRADSPYGSMSYKSLHKLSSKYVTQAALGKTYDDTTSSWIRPSGNAFEKSYVHDQTPEFDPFPYGISSREYPLKLTPFVELIYVYWLEEAMLYQSLNRIIARFQNRRAQPAGDPLANLAVSPLMPLRGILWGLVAAEDDRLSLRRRAAEYEYQYGLRLIGRAIPPAESLVERRTQFLNAFHGLLNSCHHFYKEFNDKTVDADAFPLLSNLQELHLVLAVGANNQFADVSLAARIETLDVQWMLAQPEMEEFLGGRTMVPYEEKWMGRVDTMKSMQGWADASVTHFYDLAVHGEQLLLSVRHGRWNESGVTGMSSDDAKNWALEWKPSVQRYIYAYRAVTGVDLSERVDTTMPSALLQRRLARKLVRY